MRHKNIVLNLNYTKASLQFVPLIQKKTVFGYENISEISKGLTAYILPQFFNYNAVICDI